MSRRHQNTIAILLACLIGLLPFSTSMAVLMHSPADAASHDCMHEVEHMADHCPQHAGDGCDKCANCSSHCFSSLSAIFSALILKSNRSVTFINPIMDEVPESATPTSLFRPPQTLISISA